MYSIETIMTLLSVLFPLIVLIIVYFVKVEKCLTEIKTDIAWLKDFLPKLEGMERRVK